VTAILAVASVAAIAPRALAQASSTGPDFARPGFYVHFGGATGIDVAAADELNALLGTPGLVDVETAIGFNARAGGRSFRRLAGEVQIEYLPAFEATAAGLVTAAEYRMLTVTGNLKLFVTTGRFQPYLLLGGGGAFASLESAFLPGLDVSADGFALRGGGGVEASLTEHIALVVDASYVYPTGDATDLDYVSIGWGLQYRF